MALDGTYAGLQATITSWLHRSDMASTVPDLVVLTEARIARDLRLRRQITGANLSTAAGVQAVPLPTDFLEMENVAVTSSGVQRNLEYVNIERMNVNYPTGGPTGVPGVFTFEGSSILFGPTPDGVYVTPIYYYARYSPLSVTPTNWLLTNHPNIYLFGALAEAGDYARNSSIGTWEQKYKAGVLQLQDADDQSMFSGSALRVRSV